MVQKKSTDAEENHIYVKELLIQYENNKRMKIYSGNPKNLGRV